MFDLFTAIGFSARRIRTSRGSVHGVHDRWRERVQRCRKFKCAEYIRRRVYGLLLVIGFVFFLSVPVSDAETLSQPHPLQKQPTEASTLHLDWMDPHVSPGQNFYLYANGRWLKEHPIPPEFAVWSSFRILQQAMQQKLNQLMKQLSMDSTLKKGTIEQKIGDFYFTGMDEAAVNRDADAPLKPLFKQIDDIRSLNELQTLLPQLQLLGVNALFNFGSMQDFKNSEAMIGGAMQGGLGLPDRDYYCSTDKKFAEIRAKYKQHVQKMFLLLGDSESAAQQASNTVMAIETALAQASLTQVEQRDPYAVYHKMNKAALATLTPHFAWSPYLQALGVADVNELNIGMPKFFKALDALLVARPLSDWKVYLRWQVIHAFASYLSSTFEAEDFKLDQLLTGTKTQLPRWQRVESTVNGALDFAVGKLYVERYFSEVSKQQIMELMNNIRKTFREVLQHQAWMGDETKQAAVRKLDLMTQRVGYPDKWRDYSSLRVDRGPYVLNVMRANAFNAHYDLAKIGKPVDRSEWSMSPQTINAYYDPSMNSINIPAGILQPPFFDANAPAALNYGAIGFVIGHEMTHGFDDQGALFDGHGNLKNWWTPQDKKAFNALTHCIAKQFSQYKVNGDVAVQGELVVGEATADLGGVLLAYQAYHSASAFGYAKTMGGFTPNQQFFLGVAHVWAGHIRPELARHLIATDPHPPMIYRVNGTVANIPAFQRAFAVKTPSPMIHEPACQIW